MVVAGDPIVRTDVEILYVGNPVRPISGASNVDSKTSAAPPPPEKQPRLETKPETKVLTLDLFVSYLETCISPVGLLYKGNWVYKFDCKDEIVAILESVILFVSKKDAPDGLKVFGDDNLDTWKTLVQDSTSTFFKSLKSHSVQRNLYKKYASWSVISKTFPIFPKFLKSLSFLVYHLYKGKEQDLKKVKYQSPNLVVAQILLNVVGFEQDIFPGQNNGYKLRLDFRSNSPELFPRGEEEPEGEILPRKANAPSSSSLMVGGVDPLLPKVYDFAADLRKRADDYATSVKNLARNVEECYELRKKFQSKVVEAKNEHARSSALRVDLARMANFQINDDLVNTYQSRDANVVKFLTLCEKEPAIYDEIIDKINKVLVLDGRKGKVVDDVEKSVSTSKP